VNSHPSAENPNLKFQAGAFVWVNTTACRILIDIPNRSINVDLSTAELTNRRADMEAKGKDAWKLAQPRQRRVTAALKEMPVQVLFFRRKNPEFAF